MVHTSRPNSFKTEGGRVVPATTDTLIIGNGPSSLAISFLLHGNVPFYNKTGTTPHPDSILHAKLSRPEFKGQPLYKALDSSLDTLVEHFEAAGYYSQDAWPANVLLDALLWPNASLGAGDVPSTLSFEYNAAYARDHIVLGSAIEAGGQWAEDATHGQEAPFGYGGNSGDTARTLSYAEQLSLPGYSFAQWHLETQGCAFPAYERPRRPLVSAYYAAYPHFVGLCSAIYNGTRITAVERLPEDTSKRIRYRVQGIDGRGVAFEVTCRHVVLACGLYSSLIEPPALLSPYTRWPSPVDSESSEDETSLQRGPLLVIGSGFSAADAVIENMERRPIIHVYKWDTATYTSPLKHCHRSSYPEYANIYKRMKLGAKQSSGAFPGDKQYQAFADVAIIDVHDTAFDGKHARQRLQVTVRHRDGTESCVAVSEMVVLTGRRTSLEFLGPKALQQLDIHEKDGWMEKVGLRAHIRPQGAALVVLEDMLCIGSITGDSLIKFSYGAVVGAAMRIISDTKQA
ncbi:hypothetical protein BCR37DRAFT_394862 [Protomyces lactucae-debilis]|uniref:Uncharacterized protein n=1 Tax=Protomyces lactucae-debilis TaxID=2754530 RepID=A0A1Y2F4A7_PROLT|nr:uncharacterized protein BCR37DRAFT_394862 [Protomyces lactucae-debilis]ORY77775.1 hypothetical protein BCR37DRAFT_394862 [Protomyces lactucae-debilis]